MKLHILMEAFNKSDLIAYITDWMDQSEDPDWDSVSQKEITQTVKKDFPALSPAQNKQVSKYLYFWTSSGESEEYPPSSDEVARWVNDTI